MILSLLLAATAPAATLASGHHFTCALGEQASVSCWGSNELGQLGDGTREARSSPVRVPGLTNVKDLACTKQGAVQLLAALDPAEWFFSGALSPGSTELLAPRLDVSGSSLIAGAMTRLDLLEPPRRITLVEGKGVGPSRLVSWDDVLIAAWVWTREGAPRLGLAKVLPASAR